MDVVRKEMEYAGKKKRSQKWKHNMFLIPSLIGILVFYIGPFIYLVVCSLLDNSVQGNFVGLANYREIIQNGAFMTAVQNTVLFSVISVPLAVCIPLLFALLLEGDIAGKSVIRIIYLSPMMVPTASVVLVWKVLFCYDGSVSQFVEKLCNVKPDFFSSKLGLLVILILFLWKNIGYYMIIYMAALSEIPRELLEAARMDGGSRWQQFWYIKLPYVTPSMLFVFILSLISSFKIFKEVYLLVGAYPYDTMYLVQHFINNTFMSLDYQKLSCATVLLTGVLTVILGILFYLENYIGRDFEG